MTHTSPSGIRGSIRTYRPADRDALIAITVRAFDGVSVDQNIEKRYGPINGVGWQERKARHIEADIAANPEGIFVFDLDGRVVGYIASRFDRRTGIGWIPNFAVQPGHQDKGIGKQLMQAALTYLRERGMKYVRIETLEQNQRCTALYARLGFREIARQIHYIMLLNEP